MKTLLTKFFKSLTCKLMWAMVATAAAANAHDLPSDCPLINDDWGMLQQDCMGVRESQDLLPSSRPIDSLSFTGQAIRDELIFVAADAGEPPQPSRVVRPLAVSTSEFQLDGVDCSILESQFRGYPLVEATAARAKAKPNLSADAFTTSEFDRLYYGTCTCDFEQQVSANMRSATRFIFKRECVEDSVPFQFHMPRWHFMEQLGLTVNSPSSIDIAPLAIADPVAALLSKELVADLLSKFETLECIVQAELYDCHSAFDLGKQLASSSSDWYQAALPKLVRSFNRFQMATPLVAHSPAQVSLAKGPMFVLYSLGGGQTLAIPVEQAREWKFATVSNEATASDEYAPDTVSDASESVVDTATVSPEFTELLNQTSARLKWAGGRLSQAADYLNDWFSTRLASNTSDDSMR